MPDDNSMATSCQGERNSSVEDPAHNIISEFNSNGIRIIRHNGTDGVHLAWKVKLRSLPSCPGLRRSVASRDSLPSEKSYLFR
jgi:hypothetical protein